MPFDPLTNSPFWSDPFSSWLWKENSTVSPIFFYIIRQSPNNVPCVYSFFFFFLKHPLCIQLWMSFYWQMPFGRPNFEDSFSNSWVAQSWPELRPISWTASHFPSLIFFVRLRPVRIRVFGSVRFDFRVIWDEMFRNRTFFGPVRIVSGSGRIFILL